MKILMAAMGLDIGGAETHIVELTRELIRQGHEVLVASNGGAYVEEIEAVGARHFEVPMNRRSPWPMAKSLWMLRKLIRAERPDIVHAHARIPAFLCGILKKTMDFPLVTTAHWVFDTGGVLGKLTNWGDKTIAVSEDIKDYLKKNYGLEDDNIFVTINGIDTRKFSPDTDGSAVRAEFGIPEDAPVAVNVSRLDEDRAMAAASLIAVAPMLAKRVPGAVILIAGGGGSQRELMARAEEVNLKLGYRCVVMTGPRTDINRICAAGDVFVGVSRAALEAMAASKPVVIAGNEGYLGLFDRDKLEKGVEGNFCCRGCGMLTQSELLDDVTNALTLPEDERIRLSKFGRQVVLERYSVERMARDAIRAYEAAMPPERVVLSGYYGFDNAGDEAILYALCQSIRRLSAGAEITVLSKDPAATAKRHSCLAVHRFSPFKVRRAIKKCDLLVSGGGSLFQDSTSTRSLYYYASILEMAQRMGKRTVIYANGVGPVRKEGNKRRVKRCVERAGAVTLRDPDSLRELRQMGVTREDIAVTADPVFTLWEPDRARTGQILEELGIDGPFVAVSARPYKGAPDYFDKFAALCDGINREFGVSILFVPMQPKRDEPVSWQIIDKMRRPAYILAGDYTPEELMGVIGESRLTLSMRLHALIFAARTATPALGFIYDPKVESYLDLLHQPSAGKDGDIDVEAGVRAAGVILEHRDEISRRLCETRQELTDAAERNIEALRRMLERAG